MNICVSYGHTNIRGGADYGVVNIQEESPCIREIAPKVTKYLKAQGVNVIEARIDKASSVNASMAYRVNIANSAKVDLFIEIHLNSGGGKGVETLICSRGGKAEVYAKSIVNSLAELKYSNRGVRVDKEYLGYPLYVLRNTIAPAVIVECGFTDSKEDVNRYNADAIARKIVKGITGKEPTSSNGQSKKAIPDTRALYDTNVSSNDKFTAPNGDIIKKGEPFYREYNNNKIAKVWYGPGLNKTGFILADNLGAFKLNTTHYINSNVNVPVYKEMELKNKFGELIPGEKIEYIYSDNKAAYVYFGKGLLTGCLDKKYLTEVEKEPIKEEDKETTTAKYKVQVGAFSKKENAEKYVNDLKQKGIDACIKEE